MENGTFVIKFEYEPAWMAHKNMKVYKPVHNPLKDGDGDANLLPFLKMAQLVESCSAIHIPPHF